MKLRRFEIDGFKALDELNIEMSKDLLFLIGANGAGKSSVLQALAFVRAFALGKAQEFFAERHWEPLDVRPRLRRSGRLNLRTGTQRAVSARNLAVRLLIQSGSSQIFWSFGWSYAAGVTQDEALWLRNEGDEQAKCLVAFSRPARQQSAEAGDQIRLEDIKFPGSIFSVLDVERFASGEDLALVRNLLAWAQGITSLELLSPVAMRRAVRGTPTDIGPRGERLAGFIAGLSVQERNDLISRVAEFYPLSELDAIRKTAGWIELRMLEQFEGIQRINPAHMSDGFMRILALCALPNLGASVSLILLDEVEDGIEPHILPRIIKYLAESCSCQFLMTSHSPYLINFFDQDEVCFLARLQDGRAAVSSPKDMNLFSEGAEYFGVGEIWVNASLEVVSRQVIENARRKSASVSPDRDESLRVVAFMDGL